MEKLTYEEFENLLNKTIDTKDLNICDFIDKNIEFDAMVLTDDYFCAELHSNKLEVINELVELFNNDNIKMTNQTCVSKMIETFKSFGVAFGDDEDDEYKLIHGEEGDYYLSIIPKTKDLINLYEFLSYYTNFQ